MEQMLHLIIVTDNERRYNMNVDKLNSLAINQNGFIFDPATGYNYTANEIAIDIIKMLIEGKNSNEIVDFLVNTYDATIDVATSDYEYFLKTLKNFHMVVDDEN